VLISRGQFADSERRLGQTLAALVSELTPYTGYLAQNQTSLSALSQHVFETLNSAVGFVAVMHHRGTAKTPHEEHIRGSLWVEQGIAIAAFLTAQGRHLPVALYLQNGIVLEGARQQLILNPVEFDDNAEVVEDFKRRVFALFAATSGIAAQTQ